MSDGPALLASILRHDAKQNTYKIALVRALNDVRLSYFGVSGEAGVGVPLRLLAEFWLAYYWPFMDERAPLLQGPRSQRGGQQRHDVSFRPALTQLRSEWRAWVGADSAADGFTLVQEMRVVRRRVTYPAALLAAYDQAVKALGSALRQPLRFAGAGLHGLFPPPVPAEAMNALLLPGTRPRELCVRVSRELWQAFGDLSLWVEALCVYEWSRFSEARLKLDPSLVYELLTSRPDARRPLTWERHQLELLMLEGQVFTCPWTGKVLFAGAYDLDHVIPLSVYPINELWNLVPADRQFNQHRKRDRLPGTRALAQALGPLERTYEHYQSTSLLATALANDVAGRFYLPSPPSALQLGQTVLQYVSAVAEARHLARF